MISMTWTKYLQYRHQHKLAQRTTRRHRRILARRLNIRALDFVPWQVWQVRKMHLYSVYSLKCFETGNYVHNLSKSASRIMVRRVKKLMNLHQMLTKRESWLNKRTILDEQLYNAILIQINQILALNYHRSQMSKKRYHHRFHICLSRVKTYLYQPDPRHIIYNHCSASYKTSYLIHILDPQHPASTNQIASRLLFNKGGLQNWIPLAPPVFQQYLWFKSAWHDQESRLKLKQKIGNTLQTKRLSNQEKHITRLILQAGTYR